MCGAIPMAMAGGGKKAALGAMIGGLPGFLAARAGNKDRQRQRFGDGTTVDGAMSFGA